MIELLANSAENSRNADKQSAFEIVQSHEDLEAVCLIYDYILERRNRKIKKNKERAKYFLAKNPNFYLEMRWEVNVKVPLMSYFCPNDTCKIWKYDKNVRMDYSFVEFKNLSSVRCPSSWLFLGGYEKNPNNKDTSKKLNQLVNNSLMNKINDINLITEENTEESNIFQANWKKNIYFNPFEELDESEKTLIINEIMQSHRIHGEFKLKNCEIMESLSGWSKKPVFEKINGWNAKKYEVSVTAFVKLHNKEKFYYDNFIKDNYFNSEKNLEKKIIFSEDNQNTKKNIADGFKVKNDKMRNALLKMSDNKDKKLKAYVWIADNFPIKSSVSLKYYILFIQTLRLFFHK